MFDQGNYEFTVDRYQNSNVIWIRFSYDEVLKNELKQEYPFIRWSVTNRCWYLPDNEQIRKQLNIASERIEGKQVLAQIHPTNQPPLKKMAEQLQLKGYSPNTRKTYCICTTALFVKRSECAPLTSQQRKNQPLSRQYP